MAKKNGSNSKNGSNAKKSPPAEHWGEQPDEHDYPAAASYLSLLSGPADVKKLVAALKAAPLEHHFAKDLLRSSGLALLPEDNFHVAGDLAKVRRGIRLSPVLLVRGDLQNTVPLTIADGYHRVCASYHIDENASIPCHIADGRARPPARLPARPRSSRGPAPVQ